MHAPLVSIIRCHNPNLQKSRVRNRNYLVYIATREGVDLSQTSYDQAFQDELSHIEDPTSSEERPESSNDLYLKYIAERPGSSGLFGNAQGDPVALGNHLADLTANGQNIYRGIVSLKEQDAIELGYDRKESWETLMRATMPDIAAQFHIPLKNLQWAAAVHMEKGHPHCHYMFWNKEPKTCSPFIHVSKQNKCREILSGEVFRAEREQEVIAKTMSRDLMLDLRKELSKNDFAALKENLVPGTGSHQIPGRLKNAMLSDLQTKLLALMNELPATGRINYAFVDPAIKEHIDDICTLLLSHPEMHKQFLSYMQAVENITRTYSPSTSKFTYSRQSAERDLYKRLGNMILASAKALRKELNAEAYAAKHVEYQRQHREYLQKCACYTLFRSAFNVLCSQSQQKQQSYPLRIQSTSKENRIAQAKKHGVPVRSGHQQDHDS